MMHVDAVSLVKASTACVVSSAWEGTLLVALVALLLRPMHGMSAAARFFVWSALSVVLVALPMFSLGHSGHAAVASIAARHPVYIPMFVAWTLFACWAAMSLYRLAQLLRSGFHVLHVTRESQPLEMEQRARFSLPDSTLDRIHVSTLVDVPCVGGFLHPRILLPEPLLELMPRAELTQIVQHELEHLRRGDPWLNLAQKICLTLFPLNPALWWAERRLCAERELACDDRVLSEVIDPKDYALSLTNLAEFSLARRSVSLMLGAWRKRSELSTRVHRILDSPQPWRSASTMPIAAVLTLTIAAAGIWLGRMPSIVGYADTAPATQIAAVPVRIPVAKRAVAASTGTTLLARAVRPVVRVHATAPKILPVEQAAVEAHPLHIVSVQKPTATAPAVLNPVITEPTASSEEVAFAVPAKASDSTPHVQPVFLEDAHHAYAAFRLVDGWLLIQL